MERIALIIPTHPARKRAGFSSIGFAEASEDEEVIANME